MRHVLEALQLIKADRPRFTYSESMLRLWQDEFGRWDAERLRTAVRRCLRTDKGYPNIAAIHDADTSEKTAQHGVNGSGAEWQDAADKEKREIELRRAARLEPSRDDKVFVAWASCILHAEDEFYRFSRMFELAGCYRVDNLAFLRAWDKAHGPLPKPACVHDESLRGLHKMLAGRYVEPQL